MTQSGLAAHDDHMAGSGPVRASFPRLRLSPTTERRYWSRALVLVVAAWCVYFGRRGAISTAIALSIATALVGTAAVWDYLERPLLKVIRASR